MDRLEFPDFIACPRQGTPWSAPWSPPREQIIEGGVRAFPAPALKLFAGENVGKLIIAVAPTTD